MEMCQHLMRQEGYVEGTTMVVALGSGVYEVVGSWSHPEDGDVLHPYQTMLSVPCNNLSFVGKGEGETIVSGGFVVENGRKVSFEGLTMKDSSGYGLFAIGAGTEVVLQKVTVENSQSIGVHVEGGAKLDATMSISSEQRVWGVGEWIHDDRPSHQLHFSLQQVCWYDCNV